MHPIDIPRAPGPVTGLLQRWSEGDRAAMDRVIPLVYDELRRMAQRQLRQERDGHTLQSTGLVHEAFMKLAEQDGVRWESRAHFLGWTATLMRHILVDHARARQAAKRGGGVAIESLEALSDNTQGHAAAVHAAGHGGGEPIDVIAMDQALQRLEALDAQQGRVVEMRFFGGLSVAETAEALAISPATVKREWATARAWLLRQLGLAAAPPAPTKAAMDLDVRMRAKRM